GIGFLQHPDNLLFAEPRLLHDKVSPAALPLTLQWDTSEGEGHILHIPTARMPDQSAAILPSILTPERNHAI
ncbi:hypothetical protein, partial [Burkholderia sp. Se-20373]|uniref:hypothetical protein n=1 Tax=Burkholderia sp. Se-20373 TaxID=2703898 RepID=UPI00197CEBC4